MRDFITAKPCVIDKVEAAIGNDRLTGRPGRSIHSTLGCRTETSPLQHLELSSKVACKLFEIQAKRERKESTLLDAVRSPNLANVHLVQELQTARLNQCCLIYQVLSSAAQACLDSTKSFHMCTYEMMLGLRQEMQRSLLGSIDRR